MIVGIIGDQHQPFTHPGYLAFCRDTFEKYEVTQVVNIGDVVDAHAISFHEHDPNGMSAEAEACAAYAGMQDWYAEFPDAKVCVGNHDARPFRTARQAGMPDRYVKQYADVWDTPNWDWQLEHTIDGVLYEHGTGSSGKDAAFNRAVAQRCSVVIGHVHSYAGIKYHANPFSRIFGLNVGCGIDIGAYAFDYGKMFPIRPILGCGVVIDGDLGFFVPMQCGRGEPYHRSRFSERKVNAKSVVLDVTRSDSADERVLRSEEDRGRSRKGPQRGSVDQVERERGETKPRRGKSARRK